MKKILNALMALSIAATLSACGNANTTEAPAENTAEQTQSAEENKTETSETPEVKEETSEQKAEEDAPAETSSEENKDLSGSVTVYMPSPKGLNEKYIAAFEEETGVKVDLFEGTTGEILARLEAEKDNPVADVVVLASWSDGLAMKKEGNLESYDAKDADKLYEDFIDSDKELFGTSASSVGVIYNTTIVENLDADWADFADEKYNGDIALPDPEKSGSAKDFLAGYFSQNKDDWKTWEDIAANGLTIPGANKAALEAVTTGEKAILLAGVDYNAYKSIADGEPLAIYYPKSGTVINPRPAMILKSAKNMDNAKAFIDFLISDKAQELVADAYLLPGRSDITTDKRTNVADIPQFENLDWDYMLENADEISAKMNSLVK